MGSHNGVVAERLSPWSSRVNPAGTAEDALESRSSTPDALNLAAAEDRVLVAAFNAGSQDAFAVIVTRYQRTVYQVCYRFVRNHEDAADLAQEVFVRAFKGLRQFKGDASLGTWLYRVGVNCCLNRLAVKRPATESIDDSPHVDESHEDPEGRLVRNEKAARVRRAIAQLPPKQRATVLLRVYQELSHEEIAAVLGGSVGAAKANLFHALGNLRRLLQS